MDKIAGVKNVLDILAELAEPDHGVWEFSPDTPTWLQTDSVDDGKCLWYLTKNQDSNAAYYIEVEPNAASIVDTIAHLDEKVWSNTAQLMEAMLPAIRGIRAIAWSN